MKVHVLDPRLEKHDKRLQALRAMPYQDYLLTPEWQEQRNSLGQSTAVRCAVQSTPRFKSIIERINVVAMRP